MNTTISTLFARWQVQMEVAKAAPESLADAEIDAAAMIEATMNATRPVTAAEFAIKLLVVTGHGHFQPTPELINEAQALASSALLETPMAASSRLSMELAQIIHGHPSLMIDRIVINEHGVHTVYRIPRMPALPVTMDSDDPILSAIAAFRNGMAAFNGTLTTTDEEADAAIEVTYGPPQEVIQQWDQPARTYKGAVEAVRLALQEALQFMSADTIPPMLKAALAYFDSQTTDTWEDRT